jgi:hypothetical protein
MGYVCAWRFLMYRLKDSILALTHVKNKWEI